MYELILASNSPRRKEILEKESYLFEVDTVKVSEIIDENLNSEAVAEDVARQKLDAFVKSRNLLKSKKKIALTADTIVIIEGRVLGKPKNSEEALSFLKLLSGKTHRVITGVCLYSFYEDKLVQFSEATRVSFHQTDEKDLITYIESGEPFDKAGAYAIQGLGKQFVKEISGSYSNVVGLPVEKLKEVLAENNWVTLKNTE